MRVKAPPPLCYPLLTQLKRVYTVDFRKLTKKPEGVRPFVVKAYDGIREISIRLDGEEGLFEENWLVDEESGEVIRCTRVTATLLTFKAGNTFSGLSKAMTEDQKQPISRRELLGGMGKLAYVAPTLTMLALFTNNANADGSCEIIECPDGAGTPSPKQKSRTRNRTKPRH